MAVELYSICGSPFANDAVEGKSSIDSSQLHCPDTLQSKLALSADVSAFDIQVSKSKLKLGLFSYPVLQAADVLLYR